MGWARVEEDMRAQGSAVTAVAAVLLLACAVLLVQQQAGGRTELWENYNEPDYFDRQVRQARADGIRSEDRPCSSLIFL